MVTYTLTEADKKTAEMVNHARYGNEPVLITDRGRPAAAVISAAMLARFEELEADADRAEIEKIKARGGPNWIPGAAANEMMEAIIAEAEAGADAQR
jgi:prevent-host-death family protein